MGNVPHPDPARRREIARNAALVRHQRERAAHLEERIKALVDAAPPLTEAQRARLAALLALPEPRSRRAGAA